MKRRSILLLTLVACALGGPLQSQAQTALGDWGHFLTYAPRMHFQNPEGRDFELRFHLMQWPREHWNPEEVWLRVRDPQGEDVIWEKRAVEGNELRVTVPATGAGGYTVDWSLAKEGRDAGGNFWVESDLPRSVVWTGDYSTRPGERDSAVEKRRPIFLSVVPRRWWFWVPAGTSEFAIKAQRTDRHMSQREDWGLTVLTPRGQRIAALWGQPPKTGGYQQEMEALVEVEPGNAGRFWSVEVRNGDSHQYSNVNLSLQGIPPYIARSPEEWFDGDTGERAPLSPYDEDPFMQAAYAPKDEARWPDLQHWSPSPSLGDPDALMLLGAGRFSLWNPEGRELALQFGDYLPRNSPTIEARQREYPGPWGDWKSFPKPHYHENQKPPQVLPELTSAGVHGLETRGAERWFVFSYPATPLVLRANEQGAFHLEVSGARNLYFYVPSGTRSFAVGFETAGEKEVAAIAVNAPDRTVARFYETSADREIEVPEGMDGRIWHLRLDVASASRLITPAGAEKRYLGLNLVLWLRGVPALLSPTWEQWFDPEDPAPAMERGGER